MKLINQNKDIQGVTHKNEMKARRAKPLKAIIAGGAFGGGGSWWRDSCGERWVCVRKINVVRMALKSVVRSDVFPFKNSNYSYDLINESCLIIF